MKQLAKPFEQNIELNYTLKQVRLVFHRAWVAKRPSKLKENFHTLIRELLK